MRKKGLSPRLAYSLVLSSERQGYTHVNIKNTTGNIKIKKKHRRISVTLWLKNIVAAASNTGSSMKCSRF